MVKPMGNSILDKFRAKQAESTRENIKPSDVDLLHGTGITKRVIERGLKKYEKEAQKSLGDTRAQAEAEHKFSEAIDATMQAIAAENLRLNIILDPSQLAACRGILRERVSCLIGAAGTGKTTVTKIIIRELSRHVPVIDLRESYWITQENPDGTQSRVLACDVVGSEREPEEKKPAICGASYTGRAAQQFKRVLDAEWKQVISTIHSLLGYAPVFEDYLATDPITREQYWKTRRVFRPSFGENCKLPFMVYILDEASMIPIPLFNELIDAMPENARIILIGDIHQLPPVYGKSVLGYALRKWPVFELTTIHRQAEGNAIIANAHRILRGQMPVDANNFKLIKTPITGAGDMQTFTLQVIKKLADMGRYDPYRDAVIVPQNKSMIGTTALNPHLVMLFNPEKKDEHGVIMNKRINIHTGTTHATYAVGDKVMVTANINTEEPPITNGMIGVIEMINLNGKYDQKRSQVVDFEDNGEEFDFDIADVEFELEGTDEKETKEDERTDQRQSSHVMTVKFETGQVLVCSTAGDYRKIVHGYAVTCHKMQGGECPNVIILVHSANHMLLSQEWFYTAVTRARQNVYVICNERGLAMAVKRQKIKGNNLQEKIRAYVIETGSDDLDLDEDDPYNVDREKFPILFKPERV